VPVVPQRTEASSSATIPPTLRFSTMLTISDRGTLDVALNA
jgi:hypothetical protein